VRASRSASEARRYDLDVTEIGSTPWHGTVIEDRVALGDAVVYPGVRLFSGVSVYPLLKIPAGISVPPNTEVATPADVLSYL
jgi:hypothetical protein